MDKYFQFNYCEILNFIHDEVLVTQNISYPLVFCSMVTYLPLLNIYLIFLFIQLKNKRIKLITK